MYAYVHVYVYEGVYVCLYIRMYMHIHVFKHMYVPLSLLPCSASCVDFGAHVFGHSIPCTCIYTYTLLDIPSNSYRHGSIYICMQPHMYMYMYLILDIRGHSCRPDIDMLHAGPVLVGIALRVLARVLLVLRIQSRSALVNVFSLLSLSTSGASFMICLPLRASSRASCIH